MLQTSDIEATPETVQSGKCIILTRLRSPQGGNFSALAGTRTTDRPHRLHSARLIQPLWVLAALVLLMGLFLGG